MKQLIKKIRINTTLTVVTGLHIGGSSDNVEIGGIDNPVIKIATKGNQPYIPGSSLKGKMRCLIEQTNGAVEVGQCDKVNNLFGYAKKNMPSKLIVRDAYLTQESIEKFKECNDALDMPFTENKYENTIDRTKGIAQHPRQQERVPAGAQFAIEMVVNVWDDEKEKDELLQMLKDAMRLIENDYLGGSGSRGYGQVKFGELAYKEFSAENNWGA